MARASGRNDERLFWDFAKLPHHSSDLSLSEGNAQARGSRVVEVVKRPQGAKGFVLLPKGWKVEQASGALTISRRLKADYESLIHVSAAAMLLASITRLLASITMG